MIGQDTWGIAVVLWFQSWRTPLIESLVRILGAAGELNFYMLMLPLFFWCIDRRFGLRLVVWFFLGTWLNLSVKEWVQSPRPYFDGFVGVRNVVVGESYGLPSGHAQLAVILWGMLAAWAKRRWVWIAVAAYAIVTGLSRIAGGAHFPQDVLAGWLLGLAWLALYIKFDRRWSAWLASVPLWGQLGLSLAVAGLMIALLPTEVGQTIGGTMAGVGAGLSLAERIAAHDPAGAIPQRALRYLVGIAGLVVLRFGLGAAFEALQPAAVFTVVRYGLIGLWVMLFAPWLFLRTGLAAPASPAWARSD